MSFFKQLLVLVLLGGAAYGGYQAYLENFAPQEAAAAQNQRGARPATVEVAIAQTRDMPEIIEAVGTTRARQTIEIVPEISGRVEELLVRPGQQVNAGDVLVRLDSAIARADVDEARAQLTERERTLERAIQLRETNAVAASTLDDAQARLAEARAQVDRVEQRLAERTIRAPFAGTVGLAEVDLGARVSAGTRVTWLDDLSEVEIDFGLSETFFSRVSIGQGVTATSAAFPGRQFTGVVDAVDSRIDPVSRSFRARARVPNPDGTLPAGMFMQLDLTLSQPNHVTVPEEAIVFQAAETYVFAVRDGTARRIPVQTGPRREGVVAILDGIDTGETVVIRGLHSVQDGGQVNILNADEAGTAAADASRAQPEEDA
ncbi:efflux RND transporter periplasmic adaptor subunit [Lacimonas salitolerans]|uniref:Efflux RND transporter periplasmic adaptor subunit n=1 Tax=Lacimonas salitolerans TaxID=1323750 RepID=A0ABW4EBE6_9RHOB